MREAPGSAHRAEETGISAECHGTADTATERGTTKVYASLDGRASSCAWRNVREFSVAYVKHAHSADERLPLCDEGSLGPSPKRASSCYFTAAWRMWAAKSASVAPCVSVCAKRTERGRENARSCRKWVRVVRDGKRNNRGKTGGAIW